MLPSPKQGNAQRLWTLWSQAVKTAPVPNSWAQIPIKPVPALQVGLSHVSNCTHLEDPKALPLPDMQRGP